MDFDSIWQRFRADLEGELRFAIGRASLPMYNMMRYHLGWVDDSGQPRSGVAGKRLRPFLCLHACESVGGQWQRALPVAAALELVHNFSLIHDDIQDESHERRGRLTIWSLWGMPQAINVGDGMHALALSSLLRLEESGVSHEKVVRASRLLGEASLKLCEGQYLDISYERRLDVGVGDYLEMISGKTAALFRCALEVGALVGTDDTQLLARFRSFGHSLGMMFQVHDDVLSIWGAGEDTGKSTTSDIEMKKKTLPIVFALENSQGEERETLLSIYRKDKLSPEDVDQVMAILAGLDARGYAQDITNRYLAAALSELDATGIPAGAQDELRTIAEFLLSRQH
jgi:geranylgeranyl diphosphate synthase type I